MSLASPCIKLCRICPDSGWCIGCHRSLDEIARWSGSSDEDRRLILQRVAERARQIGQPPLTRGAGA
jgi:predicted Fe-S protein YdhL (DUF1289 family)